MRGEEEEEGEGETADRGWERVLWLVGAGSGRQGHRRRLERELERQSWFETMCFISQSGDGARLEGRAAL